MDNLYKIAAAAAGAVISFFTGIPVIMWVLLAMMTLDYVTGLVTGMMGVSSKTDGGKLSSRAAFEGLMRKVMIFLVVILAVLVDLAVEHAAGVTFNAVTGATCLWFIASEGVSVLENAAELGVPIPGILRKALEVLRDGSGDEEE
ncbi:MAG: holin family protein [Candidatus Ventricola sp.]